MSSNTEIKELVAALQTALRAGRLAHAYLIAGRARSALREAAGAILSLLYCDAQDGATPCGVCTACRQAALGEHPDTLWIEPESKSRAIVVEQALALRRHMAHTTFDGGWKTVVLMDADRMNNEAFNTILKTLEEPPQRSLFLLLTDSPGEIPATIASRCQRLSLYAADNTRDAEVQDAVRAAMTADINEYNTDDGGEITTALSRSRVLLEWLDAIRAAIAEEMSATVSPETMENLERPAREALTKRLEARTESNYRRRREMLLESLMLWQRDLLLCLSGADDSMLVNQDVAPTLRQIALNMSSRQVISNMRTIQDMATQLARNLSEKMVLPQGLIKMECNNASYSEY